MYSQEENGKKLFPQAVLFVVVWTVVDAGGRCQWASAWERWPGSLGWCSWSINGPLFADPHVTQESIYSLHLIHELQAVGCQLGHSLRCLLGWSLVKRLQRAANELQGEGCGRKCYTAINHILVIDYIMYRQQLYSTVRLVICEPCSRQASVIFNTSSSKRS